MIHKKIFGDWPKNSELKNAKAVILPVPYDGTSTWIKGADKGPQAILDASYNLEFYDIETDSELRGKDIFTAGSLKVKGAPEKMAKEVKRAVADYLKEDKLVVMLGGEHSITAGAISAYKEKYKNLSVLQLDAHADMRPEYLGSKYNHACVMSRVRDVMLQVQDWCPIAQVGIRSMCQEEKKFIQKDRIFFAQDIYDKTNWQDKALAKLTDKVYLTIDLDVFDPSVLPLTGTPEPGGLGWYQVLEFLKKVMAKKNVVGFDVVELCPNEYDKSSDFLAAKLILKLLCYWLKR